MFHNKRKRLKYTIEVQLFYSAERNADEKKKARCASKWNSLWTICENALPCSWSTSIKYRSQGFSGARYK